MKRITLALLVAAALVGGGCAEEDEAAPPPPMLDPAESPTASTTVTISGSAEHGSKIQISGGAAEVETTADPYTARFRAEVELNEDAENALSVTATDAAGNRSQPATLTIAHQTGFGELHEVVLDLFRNDEETPLADPVSLKVGDRLRTRAVARDGAGNELGTPVTITSNIPGALVLGTNLDSLTRAGSFKVVATAAGSNVFSARTVELTPGDPAKVVVSYASAEARAGELVAFEAKALDAHGNVITDANLQLSVSPPLAATFTVPSSNPAVSREQGVLAGSHQFVAYDLSAVAASDYAFTLTATVAASSLSGSDTLVVKPASGAAFKKLEWNGGGTSLSLAAGQDAEYAYEVVDLYGNKSATPVSVFTSAPGATVVDDGVSGAGRLTQLTTAGAFPVSFYIAGAGKKGELQLQVGTAPAAFVDVAASTTLVGPNTDVKVYAQVRDAYGNRVACSTTTQSEVTFSASGQSSGAITAASTGCFNSAFEAVYRFGAEDNYAISATYGTGAGSVTDSVFVTVLSFDNTPPTVSIGSVQHDGIPCPAAPAVCDVRPGEFIQFVVNVNDNKSLSEISYTAFFATAGGTGSLRTRSVLVASNATLPVAQPFSFGIPGNTFIENVPLTALAIDGAGNRATSAEYLLRVTVQTFGGRNPELVLRDPGGNVVNNPEDVVVAPNGDLYVANGGNDNVLRLPTGATYPQVYATTGQINGFAPNFMELDSAGNLYMTDGGGWDELVRVAAGANPIVERYLRYGNQANLQGMAVLGKTAAKGWAAVGAMIDGDRLTVGTSTYELSMSGTCPGSSICVDVAAGATATDVANAIASCINAGTGCTLGAPGGTAASAHPDVAAAVSTTGTPAVILSAKLAGAAGSGIAFSTNACPRVAINGSTNCPSQVATLQDGFDETLFVAQENGGFSTDVIHRFPLTLTGLPRSEAAAVASYDMTVGGTSHEQWGLAVRDLSSPSSRNVRDLIFYFPDASIGTSRLRASRWLDGGPATAVFSSAGTNGGRPACIDCIRGTNDPAGPSVNFSRLWDVVVEPGGCLLVSDAGNGYIYSVDTRDPAAQDPLVSVVARGFGTPNGMDIGPDGRLYVALRNADAVVAIPPSADTTDCF